MGYAFTLTPATNKTDLTITTVTVIAITITQTSIGHTGTIIGTITIEIMIGTMTEINAARFVARSKTCPKVQYEIIAFSPCAGLRRIDSSIL
jgi:hypothetical protein